MPNPYPEDVVRKKREETAGCVNVSQAAGSNLSSSSDVSSNLPPPIHSANQQHQREQNALGLLYQTIGQFCQCPSAGNMDEVFLSTRRFQDAWMVGRRRVMD